MDKAPHPVMLELALTGQYLAKAKQHSTSYAELLAEMMRSATSTLTIFPAGTYVRPTILIGYAMLVIRAGFLAGAADTFLGRDHFVLQVDHHIKTWTLTPEHVRKWKSEALSLGVPSDLLEPTVPELHAIVALAPTRAIPAPP